MGGFHIDYRPSDFDEVYGNKTTLETLQGLLEDEEEFPHVLLFHGITGCGKTTLARIVAQYFCELEDVIEIDSGQFRGIDTIRTINKDSQFKALNSTNKVYIIDEAHKLTTDAQNAFLKKLEDTPKHVYIFLCTTDPQKLIKAVRNRCSKFEVAPLRDGDMDSLLRGILDAEEKTLSDKILNAIIKISEGVPREALQRLKQVLAAPKKTRMKIATQVIEEEGFAIALCQALMSKKATWANICKVLRTVDRKDAEGLRRAVLGYATSILLKGHENDKIGLILETFTPPLYDVGFPGLVSACYISHRG
jgi:DNA polymerase-3 subunit gamma/tau